MTKKRTFSYSKALKFATAAYIDNFMLFIIFFLLSGALFLAASALFIQPFLIEVYYTGSPLATAFVHVWRNPTYISMIVGYLIISYFIWIYYIYQLVRVGFAIYNDEPVSWKMFFEMQPKRFFKFLLATVWYNIKFILGLLLFIIPGIYFYVKYWFTGYSIIEKKTDSISEDIHEAVKTSKYAHWPLFGFSIILMLIARLSFFLFYPMSILASIHAYKQLEHNS